VSHLGQSIHNYPNGIVSRLSSQQTHNKNPCQFLPTSTQAPATAAAIQ
jgi:hypothetical protein